MRYFFEVSYIGTNYAGFQIQKNANTIQAEVEKALLTLFKKPATLTGSSRTDAGVHAIQNYFHGDFDRTIEPKAIYNLNAILPNDIAVKSISIVPDNAHARFDATSREYHYKIFDFKNPFLNGFAYYYPFSIDMQLLHDAASIVKGSTNFKHLCKTNVQVNNFLCTIYKSEWRLQKSQIIYVVSGNRFLRGMVRALVATMLKLATGKITITQFETLFTSQPAIATDFSAPPSGLYLSSVLYPSAVLRIVN